MSPFSFLLISSLSPVFSSWVLLLVCWWCCHLKELLALLIFLFSISLISALIFCPFLSLGLICSSSPSSWDGHSDHWILTSFSLSSKYFLISIVFFPLPTDHLEVCWEFGIYLLLSCGLISPRSENINSVIRFFGICCDLIYAPQICLCW